MDAPKNTRAATQHDQMNSGVLESIHPSCLAVFVKAATARAEDRQCEVKGSTGSPLDKAGKA